MVRLKNLSVKKMGRDVWKRAPDFEFERARSIDVGATFADGYTNRQKDIDADIF